MILVHLALICIVKKIDSTDNDTEKEWFVFEDNGSGMSIEKMVKYLTLLNMGRKTNYDDEEKIQHGKYIFGGKQAVLQLEGLTSNNKSDLVIILSKQKMKPLFVVNLT